MLAAINRLELHETVHHKKEKYHSFLGEAIHEKFVVPIRKTLEVVGIEG